MISRKSFQFVKNIFFSCLKQFGLYCLLFFASSCFHINLNTYHDLFSLPSCTNCYFWERSWFITVIVLYCLELQLRTDAIHQCLIYRRFARANMIFNPQIILRYYRYSRTLKDIHKSRPNDTIIPKDNKKLF